jgi:hypothetical protein
MSAAESGGFERSIIDTSMPDEHCKQEWEEYFRLKRWCVASLLLLVPGSLAVGVALGDRLGAAPFLITMMAGMAGYFRFGSPLGRWPCLRCDKPFAFRSIPTYQFPLVRKCVHCGLRVGQCP